MAFLKKLILFLMMLVMNAGVLFAAGHKEIQLTVREREAIEFLRQYGSWQAIKAAREGLPYLAQPLALTKEQVATRQCKAAQEESKATLPYDVAAIIVSYLDRASLVQCVLWGPGRVPELARELIIKKRLYDIDDWYRKISYYNPLVSTALRCAVNNNDVAHVARTAKLVDPNKKVEYMKEDWRDGHEKPRHEFLYDKVLCSGRDDATKMAMIGSFLDAGLKPATLAVYLGKYDHINEQYVISPAVCEFLLQWHVPIDEPDSENITPLMRAAREGNGQKDRVAWLLQHGANKNVMRYDETAASMARKKGRKYLADLIENFSAEAPVAIGAITAASGNQVLGAVESNDAVHKESALPVEVSAVIDATVPASAKPVSSNAIVQFKNDKDQIIGGFTRHVLDPYGKKEDWYAPIGFKNDRWFALTAGTQ